MKKFGNTVFFVFLLLSSNLFPQDENEYIAGTPYFFEKLKVRLDIQIDGKRITAVLTCRNNTGFDVYVPNHYINIFEEYEGRRVATNSYFFIYNQNREIARYFGFGTKFVHSKEYAVLLKNGDELIITIDQLEKIYDIPNGTTELFISYYSSIAPPSNMVYVEYIAVPKLFLIQVF